MTTTELQATELRPIDQAALDRLDASVTGKLIAPGHPDWDAARTPWAVAVAQTPIAVLRVADAADIQAAARWAVEHGARITAQPVGHGAGDSLDGVLLLRTRALNSVEVDVAGRVARVGAGVTAGELLAALKGTGLTFLAGSNPSVSVVGMTLTGGMSWFGRAYGIGAHSIVRATLVDGFGRLVEVDAGSDPELFWAIRGGGGDFGIVVSLDLRLHPAASIYGGRLLWPVEQMPAVLRAFREVTAVAPPELTVWYTTVQFPPFPEVPEPLRGQTFATVALAHLGDRESAETLLEPFRAVPGLAMDLLGQVPVERLGTIADEPVTPTPSLEHSFFVDDLSEEAIAALVAVGGTGSPLAALQLRHLGAAFTRTDPSAAAEAVSSPYLLFALGIPAVPELADAIGATFGRLDAGLAGHTDGRTVPNLLGPRGDLSRAYAPATRARLAAAKRAYDPLSTIRSNRPVIATRTDKEN